MKIFHLLLSVLIICPILPQVKNDLVIISEGNNTNSNIITVFDQFGNLVSNQVLLNHNIKFSTSGDFDGDGIQELLVCSNRIEQYILYRYKYLNNYWILIDSTELKNLIPNLYYCHGLSSGDINGDGLDDLALIINNKNILTIHNRISVLISNGQHFQLFTEFIQWDYSFEGITTADINGDGNDEIAIYRVEGPYNPLKRNRVLIFSFTEKQPALIRNQVFESDNFTCINSFDFNGDAMDDLVFSSLGEDNLEHVKIFQSTENGFIKVFFQTPGYSKINSVCTEDFYGNYIDDLCLITTQNFSVLNISYFKSNSEKLDLMHSYSLNTNRFLSSTSGNFRSKYPITYLDSTDINFIKLKNNERGASNYIQYHFIDYSNSYSFNSVGSIFKLVNKSNDFNDFQRQNFSEALKKISIGFQLDKSQIGKIQDAKAAFLYIAEYFNNQHYYINLNRENFSYFTGILSSQILYDAIILTDLAWAYDLLFNEFTPEERRIIRTKLFIPAVNWQLKYCSGKGNHQDWQNLAIGHVGFAINSPRFISAALLGSNISNVAEGYLGLQKNFWQGLAEQLSKPIENMEIIPPDFGYWGSLNETTSGSYFSDYTDDEGSVFYTHYSLLAMTRLALIAHNNNYFINFFNFPNGIQVLDKMAKALASIVYPDLIDFPDINNEILDEAPAQVFEMLESQLYSSPPKASPYTKILKLFRGSYNGTLVDIDEDLFYFKGFGIEDNSYYEESSIFSGAGWGLIRSRNSIADSNRLYILLDFGPYGCNNHGHADRLNLIMAAKKYGELLKDVAKIRNRSDQFYGYSSNIQSSWVESTLSHNTILINGQRQADPDYSDLKPQVKDDLYGLTDLEEHLFANRISSDLDYAINNDTLQFVSIKVPFSSAYGDNFEVERIITLLNNKFIIDEINVERKNYAPIEFIDLTYHGPLIGLKTVPDTKYEIDISSEQVNKSYNYLYDAKYSDISKDNFWSATWSNSQDSVLKIFGYSLIEQSIISCKAPNDLSFNGSTEYVSQNDKKSTLLIRSEGYNNGASEFLNIIDPTFSVKDVNYDKQNEMIIIMDKSNQKFSYKIKYGKSKLVFDNHGDITNYDLFQNYPNPFNAQTNIKYSIVQSSFVTVKIFNLLGELIQDMPQGWKTPGIYEVTLEMDNFASGVYFYSLYAPTFRQIKKMVLIK